MTTVEVAQHAPNAAAPSKVSAPSEIAAEALASSSALFSEHARCEWELLLTALTVVGGDDSAEGSGEAAAGNASSSAGNGQPSPAPPSPSFPSLASAAARGDYSLAFATPEARRILLVSGEKCGDEEEDEDEAARRYWSSVADACAAASSPSPSASLERLALGASALLAFVQAAFTGPELERGTPRERQGRAVPRGRRLGAAVAARALRRRKLLPVASSALRARRCPLAAAADLVPLGAQGGLREAEGTRSSRRGHPGRARPPRALCRRGDRARRFLLRSSSVFVFPLPFLFAVISFFSYSSSLGGPGPPRRGRLRPRGRCLPPRAP